VAEVSVRLKVIWSPSAVGHFSAWLRYIARDSKKAAELERKNILAALEKLKRFPNSGRPFPEFNNPTLREILKGSIRILYRQQGREFRILTFHHASRPLDLELFE